MPFSDSQPSKIHYNGNLKWLPERTIFYTVHGSRSYGCHTPESDYDYKGICIPPKEYFYGVHSIFDQAISGAPEPDVTIFDIRKFFKLASVCNPSSIEIIFTEDVDHIVCTKLGRKIIDNRDLFLSKKVRFTYTGYSVSQLKRMKLHYSYNNNPLTGPPTRKEFGLKEKSIVPKEQFEAVSAAIQKQIDRWNLKEVEELEPSTRLLIMETISKSLSEISVSKDNLWQCAARTIGINDNMIQILDVERRYEAKKKEWEHYLEWKKNRNPKRAALEEKFKIDLKHAYSLIRLLRMAEEILLTGKVLVKRPDFEELLAIRNGAWSYEKIIEYAEQKEKDIAAIYDSSKLPKSVDINKIEKICVEICEQALK